MKISNLLRGQLLAIILLSVLSIQADGKVLQTHSGLSGLLPVDEATHVVENSGNWSESTTWKDGIIPTRMAKILIPEGTTLTVDSEIAVDLKIIRIQGKLAFSNTNHTSLRIETIIQDSSGELEMGTSEHPIPSNVSCKITIIDDGDLVLTSQQFEKGLILTGKTVAYGAAKTSWLKVAVNPGSGSSEISLAAAPSGWEVGDRIVITGTDPIDVKSDEVGVIKSIAENIITLEEPLAKSHTTPASDLFVHVANLSRNIVIESESPTSNSGLDRGHIMFMHTLDVDFNNVRLSKMGRTRKDIQVDDWFITDDDLQEQDIYFEDGPRNNIRGRYSIHFHRGGVDQSMSPAYVRGCVVEDDPGWAYVNHSSFVHFDNNVSYDVIGGGFQTESGDELGSFSNNIAIRTVNTLFPLRMEEEEDHAPDTRENSQDFAFQGDGFWVHGGGVALTGNVASGCSGHGIIYWPEGLIEPGFPTGTYNNTYKPSNLGIDNGINESEPGILATGWYPIVNFQNNEAYSATIGLATYYLHTTFFGDEPDYDPSYIETVHSTFDGFTAWNLQRAGIQLNYTERVTFKNIRLQNFDGNDASIGISASHFRALNQQIIEDFDIQGFGTGIRVPTNGLVTIGCGTLKNGTNLYIPSVKKNYRDMSIHGVTLEADPSFSNYTEIVLDASITSPDDKYPAYFLLPDKILLNYGEYDNQRLYFDEQAADHKPIPFDGHPYTMEEDEPERYVLERFVAKTNTELKAEFDMSFAGEIMPEDAQRVSNISGGKIKAWEPKSMNVPKCITTVSEPGAEEINECLSGISGSLVDFTLPDYVHKTETCDAPDFMAMTVLDLEGEKLTESKIAVYPNPSAGQFTVHAQEILSYELISIEGKVFKKGMLSAGENNILIKEKGMFLIRVKKGDYVETLRIISID
jgi:hypothetical protein